MEATLYTAQQVVGTSDNAGVLHADIRASQLSQPIKTAFRYSRNMSLHRPSTTQSSGGIHRDATNTHVRQLSMKFSNGFWGTFLEKLGLRGSTAPRALENLLSVNQLQKGAFFKTSRSRVSSSFVLTTRETQLILWQPRLPTKSFSYFPRRRNILSPPLS